MCVEGCTCSTLMLACSCMHLLLYAHVSRWGAVSVLLNADHVLYQLFKRCCSHADMYICHHATNACSRIVCCDCATALHVSASSYRLSTCVLCRRLALANLARACSSPKTGEDWRAYTWIESGLSAAHGLLAQGTPIRCVRERVTSRRSDRVPGRQGHR